MYEIYNKGSDIYKNLLNNVLNEYFDEKFPPKLTMKQKSDPDNKYFAKYSDFHGHISLLDKIKIFIKNNEHFYGDNEIVSGGAEIIRVYETMIKTNTK